jgi:hypothetical protein
MKSRNIVSFAVTLLGMSGLLFQTSCKSSRPSNEEAYSFDAEIQEINNKLNAQKENIQFAIVDKTTIRLPIETEKGSTVNYIPDSELNFDNDKEILTLKTRTAGSKEIKYTLKNGDHVSEEQTLPVVIASGDEVAQHYADKLIKLKDLKIGIKQAVGKLTRGFDIGTNSKVKVFIGDNLVLPTLATQYTGLGLSIVPVNADDFETPLNVVGPKKIKLKVELKEKSVSSGKSKEEIWDLEVTDDQDAFNQAEIEAIVGQAQNIAAQAVATAADAVNKATSLAQNSKAKKQANNAKKQAHEAKKQADDAKNAALEKTEAIKVRTEAQKALDDAKNAAAAVDAEKALAANKENVEKILDQAMAELGSMSGLPSEVGNKMQERSAALSAAVKARAKKITDPEESEKFVKNTKKLGSVATRLKNLVGEMQALQSRGGDVSAKKMQSLLPRGMKLKEDFSKTITDLLGKDASQFSKFFEGGRDSDSEPVSY